MTRFARSTSAGDGANASFAAAICFGWMSVWPSKPRSAADV
jgi:hypothetical protein